MVGGEHDVDVVGPSPCGDGGEHTPDRLVDQLDLDGIDGVHLAHLVGGHRRRHPVVRGLVVADQPAVVPGPPVARLGVEHRLALGGVGDVSGRQVDVAPRHAVQFALRRVPRVVRVGEAHPAEPVVGGAQRIEPGDRAVGHPVGVVPLARDGVVPYLRRAGVAAAHGVHLERPVEHGVEHAHRLGVGGGDPTRVVQLPGGTVGGRLEVLEAAVWPEHALAGEAVLREAPERVEERLEVRLADDGGAVAGVVQHLGHRRRRLGQRHTVHPHPVGARVLAGQHGGARRHAHHALRMGAAVVDALRRQAVDHRCARQCAAVAAERVVTLLVGGDEQDLAAHQCVPSVPVSFAPVSCMPLSIWRLSSSRALAVPPPMTSAIVRGSASVE